MESIVYGISVIFIFVMFMLLKKSDKQISVIKTIVIGIALLICYNAFICFILGEFKIHISLYLLGVINFIVGALLLIPTIKSKSIQTYYCNVQDIVATVIVLIITLVLSYLNFGGELHIKYIMTDAAAHFSAAREFYEYGTTVNNIENEAVSGQFMMGAYTNTGILMKVFGPVIGEMNIYMIFTLFDICMLFIMGMSLYVAVDKLINKKWKFILSMFMILFFMAGYPYNSMICGYVYLQIGVLLISIIMTILSLFEEGISKKFLYITLTVLNIGILATYIIFAPVIFIVEFIFIMRKRYSINKKIFTLKNILIAIVVFLIPCIFAIYYYVMPGLIASSSGNGEMFYNLEGYIYRNLWANFIFLIPIALMCIKNKNDDISIWITTFSTLLIIMLSYLILINVFRLATYYYYKFNYILWYLLWYGSIYSINAFEGKKEKVLSGFIILYMIIGIFVIYFGKVEINQYVYNVNESIKDVYEIYGINKTIIKDVEIDLDKYEIDLYKFVHDNINLEDNNILLVVNPRQEWWFKAFFNYSNRDDFEVMLPSEEIYKWNDNQYTYALITYKGLNYKIYEKFINKGNIEFQNNSGIIYKSN